MRSGNLAIIGVVLVGAVVGGWLASAALRGNAPPPVSAGPVASAPAAVTSPTLIATRPPATDPPLTPSPPPATATTAAPPASPTTAATSSPVPTTAATPPPSPSPSPLPSSVADLLGGPPRTVLDDRFQNNQPGWPNRPDSTVWLVAHGLQLFARIPGHHVAVIAPGLAKLQNVAVTGEFHKVSGPAGGGYGLILRDQATDDGDGLVQVGPSYVLEADDRGEVGIWRRQGTTWINLVPWTASTTVNPGSAVNQLTAVAAGSHLTLLVNGTVAATASDSTLGAGRVGIFVGGDSNQAIIDRFTVQVPPTGG
jgi:hypothetical protein